VFENRVLRRIVGPKREEVPGGWRRLHNEELHNLHTLPNMVRVIKDGEVGRACSMHGRNERFTQFWSENLKGRDNSEGLGIDEIILEWMLGKLSVDWMHLAQDRTLGGLL
jgi:hypothetical protein